MDIIRYDHEDIDIKTETRMGEFVVVWTKFHGGGVRSRHASLRRAVAISRMLRGAFGCVCGCVGVIDAADYEHLPIVEQAFSASDLARREV